MSAARSIVVGGAIAQRPGIGGHAWVFLQYLLGFRRLGFDVLFVDRLTDDVCVDDEGRGCLAERSENLRYVAEVMRAFGLERSFAVLLDDGRSFGCSRDQVARRVRGADLLLNVMGYIDDPELLDEARRRVFLDIDPGFPQMWRALELADPFADHDVFVTVGENIGHEACTIPTCGLDWITTPQPLVLDEWPVTEPPSGAFTSVGAWRGPYGPVEYDGRTFGLRVHEFRRFGELPRRATPEFEVALDIDAAETPDIELLRAGGWRLVDPAAVAATPATYRDYIGASLAEFTVAKNMYVQSQSGWFSDRSICYLAAGRPVLAQDSGIRGRFGDGEGLVLFSTPDEAVEGAERIAADPAHHSRAARAIAEEHFDSDRVLGRLLTEIGVD